MFFLLLMATSRSWALPPEPLELSATLTGSWPGSDFGAVLACAGDVDLNGKPDLLVGAPFDPGDGSSRGRAVLYLADRDNSGYAGESWTVVGTRDLGHYGGALAGGADVDGDGFDDIAVASTYQDWQVDLYLGGETGPSTAPDWSVNGGGGSFGHSIALVGDMDGDGYAELAIGNRTGGDSGQITVYFGTSAGLGTDPVILSGDADHPVGALVAGAGDVDGDGLADLLSGAGGDVDTPTAVAIFRGDASGPPSSPSYTLASPSGAADFGVTLAGGSPAIEGGADINGDGFDDVFVGADGEGAATSTIGQVLGWAGAASGPAAAASWTYQDPVDGTVLGRSLAVVGDVDGDGFADVLAGRPGFQDGERLEGGAVLLMGSADGLGSGPAWQGSSDQDAGDHGDVWIGYGQAVVGLGDVNGDEKADVAVGAPNTGSNAYEDRLGTVFIYTGTAYRAPAEEPDTGAGDTADSGVSGSGPSAACGCSGGPQGIVGAWWAALLGLGWRARRRSEAAPT